MDAKQILEQEAKRHGLPLDSHKEGEYAYPPTQWFWLGIKTAFFECTKAAKIEEPHEQVTTAK